MTPVPWRPACPTVEGKLIRISPHHPSEGAEVGACGVALSPSDLIKTFQFTKTFQDRAEARAGFGKSVPGWIVVGLAGGAQQHLPAVLNFGRHNLPRDKPWSVRIGKRQVLRTPEQHIALYWPLYPRLEASSAVEPYEASAEGIRCI